MLSKRLQAVGEHTDDKIHEIVAELQAEILNIKEELASVRLPSEKRYRVGMCSLALSFVIYGLASGRSSDTCS